MPWEVSCIVVVAIDEKVREETSNAELLEEPISLSFGAQQLVNEESRGDGVVHPVTARMQTCLLKVLAYLIPRIETGLQEWLQENWRYHPEWAHRTHPWFPLSHYAANSSKCRANETRQTWAHHRLTNAPANILHNVHYAGSQNQLIKCLWFVPFNLHWLDVQLHIGGQVDLCHAEVCQRLHHIHHRRKDRVRMSRWCINQWPEQVHRWSYWSHPIPLGIECGRQEQGLQPLGILLLCSR